MDTKDLFVNRCMLNRGPGGIYFVDGILHFVWAARVSHPESSTRLIHSGKQGKRAGGSFANN